MNSIPGEKKFHAVYLVVSATRHRLRHVTQNYNAFPHKLERLEENKIQFLENSCKLKIRNTKYEIRRTDRDELVKRKKKRKIRKHMEAKVESRKEVV